MQTHEALLSAVTRYFQTPPPPSAVAHGSASGLDGDLGLDALHFLQALEELANLLSSEPELLMQQCVAVVNQANAILDAEGRQLGEIFSQQGKPIVCKPGCVGCCQQLVLCQPFEAQNITAYLHSNSEKLEIFQAAHAQWQQVTAPFLASYVAWAEAVYARGEDSHTHSLADYHTPCPMLDAAGCCAIYPVRPYGCRTCIALDAACAEQRHPRTLDMQFSLYTTHHALRTALNALLLRRLGLEQKHIAMPDMLADLCKL